MRKNKCHVYNIPTYMTARPRMRLYGPESRYGRRLRWWEVLRLALEDRLSRANDEHVRDLELIRDLTRQLVAHGAC